MRIVIRIGGSVIASPVNSALISKYTAVLKELKSPGQQVVVVVGGGSLAREFIALGKQLQLDEKAQDRLAISVSRLFAQVFAEKLGDICSSKIPTTTEQAGDCVKQGKIVVMGGLKPGMTTDTVAALVAEKIGANLLIKGSNQEGVYNRDPARFPEAKKLDKITLEELVNVLDKTRHVAGIHQIVDPEAIEVLHRARIRMIVINGFEPQNVTKAIKGEPVGTLISD
jgi:uridylate kinase